MVYLWKVLFVISLTLCQSDPHVLCPVSQRINASHDGLLPYPEFYFEGLTISSTDKHYSCYDVSNFIPNSRMVNCIEGRCPFHDQNVNDVNQFLAMIVRLFYLIRCATTGRAPYGNLES